MSQTDAELDQEYAEREAKAKAAFAEKNLTGGWVDPVIPSLADDLEGRLVAMLPLYKEQREGDYGRREVTVTQVWYLDAGPSAAEVEPYGLTVPIRWNMVQRQLAKCSDEVPWAVGEIRKKGRSYVLEPISPRERVRIVDLMETVATLAAMQPETISDAGDDDGDDPGVYDEAF